MGDLLGISSLKPSNIYLLETVINKDINVICHINMGNVIVDFLIFDRDKILHVLILIKTCAYLPVGNCIEIYKVNKSNNVISKSYKIYSNNYYQNLSYSIENNNDFISIPYLFKQLHFLKIEVIFWIFNISV
jgi:hypothetical protein